MGLVPVSTRLTEKQEQEPNNITRKLFFKDTVFGRVDTGTLTSLLRRCEASDWLRVCPAGNKTKQMQALFQTSCS